MSIESCCHELLWVTVQELCDCPNYTPVTVLALCDCPNDCVIVQGPLTNTQCWNFRWASRAVAMNCFEWLSKSCVIVQTTLLWLYWHCVTVQGIVWFSNFAGKSDTFIWLVVSTFWLALSDCPRVVWLSELHSCDCIGIVWLSKWLCDCPRSPY